MRLVGQEWRNSVKINIGCDSSIHGLNFLKQKGVLLGFERDVTNDIKAIGYITMD